MTKRITKAEFAARMREIAKSDDPERAHSNADDLLAETLTSLGYDEGVVIFDNMPKWYA